MFARKSKKKRCAKLGVSEHCRQPGGNEGTRGRSARRVTFPLRIFHEAAADG